MGAMELGIYTFGDIVPDVHTGRAPSPAERMAQVLDMARLADQAGLDVMGFGEHHNLNFVIAATATTMAAAAAVTKNLRLASASTLLATADPVRIFQEFSTVDLVSGGRAEIIFGRGAFPEHFPLFGYDYKDYDAAFAEKLDLFLQINGHERVTWSGRFRPALQDAQMAPRPAQPQLPVWIGALSPNSIARAAILGLPLTMPLLGSDIAHYARLAALYRQVWEQAGRDPADIRIAGFSHMHVADTAQTARDDYYPSYSHYFAHLSGRGGISRAAFDQMCAKDGVLVLGSPQEIIDRLMTMREAIGLTRYVGQIDIGGRPYGEIARAIELYAAEVAPVIRRETRD